MFWDILLDCSNNKDNLFNWNSNGSLLTYNCLFVVNINFKLFICFVQMFQLNHNKHFDNLSFLQKKKPGKFKIPLKIHSSKHSFFCLLISYQILTPYYV